MNGNDDDDDKLSFYPILPALAALFFTNGHVEPTTGSESSIY